MKKIVLILIIAIIIIGSIFAINQLKMSKIFYDITKITQFNFFVYREENNYGVINKNGEIVIEANYDSVIIPNPQVDIFICYKDENNIVLNSNNEKIFTEFEKVEPIELKNSSSTLCYEKSVLKFEKDNFYGLIDFNGNIITKNEYQQIENLDSTEGKLIVTQNDKLGIINIKGKILVEPKYDKISTDEFYDEKTKYAESGFIVATKELDGYKYGYINFKGKKVLETKFNALNRIKDIKNKKIYLIVQENGKTGLYKNNKKIIEPEYQAITYATNSNILIVQKNKLYGILSLDGKQKLAINNTQIEEKGIYLYVQTANKNIVYDKDLNEINIDFSKSIYKTANENYNISILENNSINYYGITDSNSNILVKEEYRYIDYLIDNYFIAKNEQGKIGLINSDGKILLDFKYDLIQNIDETNLIQALITDENYTEIYNCEINKIYDGNNIIINNFNEYIKVSNENIEEYFDKNGIEIDENNEIIQNANFVIEPDYIGDYEKVQYTLNDVYYAK